MILISLHWGFPFSQIKQLIFSLRVFPATFTKKNKRPQMLQGGRCYHFPVFMDPVVLTGSCSIS